MVITGAFGGAKHGVYIHNHSHALWETADLSNDAVIYLKN